MTTDNNEMKSDMPATSTRPNGLPDKFWDEAAGVVRLDALIKSYGALEKKLSKRDEEKEEDLGDDVAAQMTEQDRTDLFARLGRPEHPDGYCIACDHGYFKTDPDLNARFHALGLTQDQVQAVYDIAAEKMVPMILDIVADAEADRALAALVSEFGGADKWREMARQMLAFGRKNLPTDILEKLAASPEGIHTLHRLMTAQMGQSGVRFGRGSSGVPQGTDHLYALMRDPKYWRDHDPAVMQKVSDGFAALYG